MARSHPFARPPIACLLAALCCVSCISPQAATRADASQDIALRIAEGYCHSGPGDANWRAAEQELRVQGLALRVQCVDMRPQGVELVVRDSGRASAVLRGPLADGEPVEIGAGAGASPDVQFNRAWLDQALLRHRVEFSAPHKVRDRRLGPQSMDLATH